MFIAQKAFRLLYTNTCINTFVPFYRKGVTIVSTLDRTMKSTVSSARTESIKMQSALVEKTICFCVTFLTIALSTEIKTNYRQCELIPRQIFK